MAGSSIVYIRVTKLMIGVDNVNLRWGMQQGVVGEKVYKIMDFPERCDRILLQPTTVDLYGRRSGSCLNCTRVNGYTQNPTQEWIYMNILVIIYKEANCRNTL